MKLNTEIIQDTIFLWAVTDVTYATFAAIWEFNPTSIPYFNLKLLGSGLLVIFLLTLKMKLLRK